VKVGLSAGSVTLQANPGSVSENGGSVDLLAIVRDDQGQLLADAEVNFSSPIGILDSGGEPVATDPSGVARDVLEVDEAEIGTADDFTVEAEVASGEGALLKDDVKVSVLRRPRANFNSQVNRFQVVFEDTSTGEPTSWEWEFDVTDQGSGPTSRLQNPVHTYGETGAKTVRLTVRNAQGDDEITKIIQITAQ
jgi:PKD repeat protein